MAQARFIYEGIYASPNSSQSSSYSELGLTLLPSPHSDTWGKNQGGQAFEGILGAFSYPSPTLPWGSIASTHDLLKQPVNASNGGLPKQSLSIAADDQPTTTPLFVQLRSIDRSGRISHDKVTPTFVTAPVQYQPSAPHLHVIVSTGTTLAAATQIDHLKARNKQLTMDRDRFYHLSKPATRRADDGKSEQIRQLNAELKAALGKNSKIQWALETQTARAQAAYQSASSYKAQLEALQAAYSTLVTGNPSIPIGERSMTLGPFTISEMRRPSAYIDLTSTKPAALQQRGPQNRTCSSLAAVMPAMTSPTRPSTPANGPPAKRQRLSSSTEKQPQKQHSMLNGSQMTDIQARLRQELRRGTGSYSWTNKEGKAENANGVEATIRADIAREEAEDELSESEIAAFDRALEEDGDGDGDGGGEGDGHSLFGDGFL